MTVAASRSRSVRASAADVFHALSDDTRLAVLDMLRGGERCVCDLQDALDAAQSRLSFHLKVLKDAGLVTDRKDGRWSYYSLNAERLADAMAVLSDFATPVPVAVTARLHSLTRASSRSRPATSRVRRVVAERGDGCC
jgi:ArsR family transcriptional regulator, arsenate/arsenite/antimonite-responsive transcriptional repressor